MKWVSNSGGALFTSAPAFISEYAISLWPFAQAANNGVPPPEVGTFTSAPASIRAFTIGVGHIQLL